MRFKFWKKKNKETIRWALPPPSPPAVITENEWERVTNEVRLLTEITKHSKWATCTHYPFYTESWESPFEKEPIKTREEAASKGYIYLETIAEKELWTIPNHK